MDDSAEIKARAYKTLYEKYHNLHYSIVNQIRTLNEHESDLEKKTEVLEGMTDQSKYDYFCFAKEEDLVVIRVLEYILGERDKID